MRSRLLRIISFLWAPVARAVTSQTSMGTAGRRDAEQENEKIVYRGAVAYGVERWRVKAGIDRDARLANLRAATPTSIIKMRSLARGAQGYQPVHGRRSFQTSCCDEG